MFETRTVLPSDAQYSLETAQVENIESTFLKGVQCPCFTAVKQCAEHTGLVYVHCCAAGQELLLSNTLLARRAITVAALPMRAFSSVSNEKVV